MRPRTKVQRRARKIWTTSMARKSQAMAKKLAKMKWEKTMELKLKKMMILKRRVVTKRRPTKAKTRK
jgi:hypothetical protein